MSGNTIGRGNKIRTRKKIKQADSGDNRNPRLGAGQQPRVAGAKRMPSGGPNLGRRSIYDPSNYTKTQYASGIGGKRPVVAPREPYTPSGPVVGKFNDPKFSRDPNSKLYIGQNLKEYFEERKDPVTGKPIVGVKPHKMEGRHFISKTQEGGQRTTRAIHDGAARVGDPVDAPIPTEARYRKNRGNIMPRASADLQPGEERLKPGEWAVELPEGHPARRGEADPRFAGMPEGGDFAEPAPGATPPPVGAGAPPPAAAGAPPAPGRPVGGRTEAAPPAPPAGGPPSEYDEYTARVNRAGRRMGVGNLAPAKTTDINPETGENYTQEEIYAEQRAGIEHRMGQGTGRDRTIAANALRSLDQEIGMYNQQKRLAKDAADAAARGMNPPDPIVRDGFLWDPKSGRWDQLREPKEGKTPEAGDYEMGRAFADFGRYFNTDDMGPLPKKAIQDAHRRGVPYAQIAEELGIERRYTELDLTQKHQEYDDAVATYNAEVNRTGIFGGKKSDPAKVAEGRKAVQDTLAELQQMHDFVKGDLSGRRAFGGESRSSVDELDSNSDGKVDENDEIIMAALHFGENPDAYPDPKQKAYLTAVLKSYQSILKQQADAVVGGGGQQQ